MVLVLNVGDASKIPPYDLSLYAPVRETAHCAHFKNIILAVKLYGNWFIELVALIMNVPAPALHTPSRLERSRIVSFFSITTPHEANPPQVSQVYGDD